MPKKKILVIGMVDSIHLVRWLSQFVDSKNQIRVFPSTHFRAAHKKMYGVTKTNIRLLGLRTFRNFLGYFDSLATLRFLGDEVGYFIRGLYLKIYIFCYRPSVIHAIEIQHAGYLASKVKKGSEKRILTNWGSDIYFFQHIPGHEKRIRNSLAWATHYSAECTRDYDLAKRFGFNGINLEKIPNAGGFALGSDIFSTVAIKDQLIVKCYGGTFGLGQMAIAVCSKFLAHFEWSKVFLYSVTNDLLKQADELSARYPGRVRFSTLTKSLPHEEILDEFRKSRVYLGLSRSDGLSTSFLEALSVGAYPIQSNTSCANELIELGAMGSIVEPEFSPVLDELIAVFGDEKRLEKAKQANNVIAKNFLNYEHVQNIAQTYYT